MAVIKSRNEWLSYNLGYQLSYTLSVTLLFNCCFILRHEAGPKPIYTTVGHLNVGSVGRLIPTMSRKMLGKGLT